MNLKRLKLEAYTLYVAMRDPRTPWYARVVAGLVVAYAFSPIDLIPDFIPVLGYLDDLLLVPLGVLLARALVPAAIWQESQEQAARMIAQGKPRSLWGAVIVIVIWLGALALALHLTRGNGLW